MAPLEQGLKPCVPEGYFIETGTPAGQRKKAHSQNKVHEIMPKH